MDRTRIRLPLLEPEACPLSISQSPQVGMTTFALVGKEEPDIQGFQCRIVERQRAFDIAYSQDDVVDHILSFRMQGLRLSFRRWELHCRKAPVCSCLARAQSARHRS